MRLEFFWLGPPPVASDMRSLGVLIVSGASTLIPALKSHARDKIRSLGKEVTAVYVAIF